MTNFTKDNLVSDSMYVFYVPEGETRWSPARKFVARFKYAGDSKGPFMTFLRKNFTVEEFFARVDAGESPLPILESKGFMLSHIKKWLKRDGYPVTQAGFRQFMADSAAKRADQYQVVTVVPAR